jgi:formylglycine-generating enzyme required for sulfatase activity
MNASRLGLAFLVCTALFLGCSNSITPEKPARAGNYQSATLGTLKYIPAGTFTWVPAPGYLCTQTESAFRMGATEVTQAQYTSVMGGNPSAFSTGADANSRPVEQVTWFDAVDFCNKLSVLENLTPVYTMTSSTQSGVHITAATVTSDWSANGYRLPTEMEWMWAAMGADTGNSGAVNTTGYLNPFAGSTGSNSMNDCAWSSANSGSTTHPVAGKSPNELGLFDLSGNVWEWCWDNNGIPNSNSKAVEVGSFVDYRGSSVDGGGRLRRGISWNATSVTNLASFGVSTPSGAFSSIGFRVVRR